MFVKKTLDVYAQERHPGKDGEFHMTFQLTKTLLVIAITDATYQQLVSLKYTVYQR